MVGQLNAFTPQVSAYLQPGRADQQQQATRVEEQVARRATAQQPQGEVVSRSRTDERTNNRREAPFAGTERDNSRSRPSQDRGTIVDLTV